MTPSFPWTLLRRQLSGSDELAPLTAPKVVCGRTHPAFLPLFRLLRHSMIWPPCQARKPSRSSLLPVTDADIGFRHALRKSGTFTALDFAPPPRFRSSTDTRSDSGSIRSNRSGMSAAQLHSIRAGAYRVSRIPQGLGGSKQELADTLRPQWDIRK